MIPRFAVALSCMMLVWVLCKGRPPSAGIDPEYPMLVKTADGLFSDHLKTMS